MLCFNPLIQNNSCHLGETFCQVAFVALKVVATLACIFFACMAYHSAFEKAWDAVAAFSVLSAGLLVTLTYPTCKNDERKVTQIAAVVTSRLPPRAVSAKPALLRKDECWLDLKGELRRFTTPLILAAKRKDSAAISSLIASRSFEPFDRDNALSALVSAAIKAENPLLFLEHIKQLLEQGFESSTLDSNGDTAHHVLVRHAHVFGFTYVSEFESVINSTALNAAGYTPQDLKKLLETSQTLPLSPPCTTAKEELLRARSTAPSPGFLTYAGRPWLYCDFLLHWLDHKEIPIGKISHLLFNFVRNQKLLLTEKELLANLHK